MKLAIYGLVSLLGLAGTVIGYLYKENTTQTKGQTELMKALAAEASQRVERAYKRIEELEKLLKATVK